MKKHSFFGKIKVWASSHKFLTVIILIIILGGGYYAYGKIKTANAVPQYVLSPVRTGSITQTVTGSGQVSAENQLDVTSEVSGKVQSISVSVGQHVVKGQLLASLDSHDAAISLESARIAYAKLTKPAKAGDVANAENSVSKAYNDGFSTVSTTYLDLPTIMTGAKDLLYGQTGFLSDQKSSYLIPSARVYRDTAAQSYDKAIIQYQAALGQYKNLTRASTTTSIDQLMTNTQATAKSVAAMLQNIQNTLTFITSVQPDYNPKDVVATASSVNSWSSTINGDISSIVSAQNAITSSANSLGTLVAGADDLDIQSQHLSLQQAEETYQKYFIRAPFDGIVGRIPVSVYAQASASTVITTIVGDQKIANVSLNEVDAAKVKAGQTVHITFDAIDGLNATGTVSQVDLVGAVSQGVVSYGVKIIITTSDDRIKPGMSLNVSIVTKEKIDVLVVPSSAIKTQGTRKYVEVLTRPTGASPTSSSASSTRQSSGGTRTMTISSATPPKQATVTLGDSDDTNTEIISGLEQGQFVVTRTIAAGTASATTATPNILSGIGGNRGAGGGTRTFTR